MKAHINQIPPEGMRLEGEESADGLELPPEFRAAGPLRYDLHVGLSGGGLFATGRIELDLETDCVTCLERFSYPLRLPDFAMQTDLLGPETVDLTPFVREDIFLALPPHPHCDWNGERVCGGVRALPAETPEAPPTGAWDALDQLKKT